MPPRISTSSLSALSQPLRSPPSSSRLCRNIPRGVLIATPRQFSTSKARKDEAQTPEERRPRWSFTPERMKAPLTLKYQNTSNVWNVNESQEKLDAIYNRILGEGGDKLLTEEVKWLTVTHKSFDQGRRGYNDRLAFLGKRIVNLQTSLALLNQPDNSVPPPPDSYDREPFNHSSTNMLSKLSEDSRLEMASKNRVARMAESMGLMSVIRWKPRKAKALVESGSEGVLAQALYAIIGAIALQKGGETATKIVRERILPQLGLK